MFKLLFFHGPGDIWQFVTIIPSLHDRANIKQTLSRHQANIEQTSSRSDETPPLAQTKA